MLGMKKRISVNIVKKKLVELELILANALEIKFHRFSRDAITF